MSKKRKSNWCSSNLTNSSRTVMAGNFTKKQNLITNQWDATSPWSKKTTPKTRCGSALTSPISSIHTRSQNSTRIKKCARLASATTTSSITISGWISMTPKQVKSLIKPPPTRPIKSCPYDSNRNSWGNHPSSLNCKNNSHEAITTCCRSLCQLHISPTNHVPNAPSGFLGVLIRTLLSKCLAIECSSTVWIKNNKLTASLITVKCISQFTSTPRRSSMSSPSNTSAFQSTIPIKR